MVRIGDKVYCHIDNEERTIIGKVVKIDSQGRIRVKGMDEYYGLYDWYYPDEIDKLCA